jgi:uncharacterized membrane protein
MSSQKFDLVTFAKGLVQLAAGVFGLILTWTIWSAWHDGNDPAKQPPSITWSQYEDIVPGMTYTEVVKALHQKGEQTTSTDMPDGSISRSYTFGPSSGQIIVVFDNETVIGKYPDTLQAPPLASGK